LSEYRKSILNFIAKKTVLNMKNKEFYKLLKKNKLNSNSGFTLIELLVGLFMSIFVIGALGFGLMTVLQTSQRENSKVKARTENSRALDFVSDEVRRARNIETNVTSANVSGTGGTFSLTGKTPVFALDIPEINSRGKIVYYLKSTGLGSWKGPQVLYRWGPPLDANGNYTTGGWSDEALIDGINDTTVSSPCTASGGTVTPATPKGFYACITGTNTAQLFLTGQTKTASGVNDDSQTNDTQVVARARETLANKIDDNTSLYWSVEGLGGDYKCKDGKSWDMRTDFSNSATPDTDPNKVSWTQVPGGPQQQPQPIEIKSNLPLKLTSNPVLPTGVSVATECNSSSASVDHTINFGNPTTFNGVCDASLGTGSCPTPDKPRVKGDSNETVQFFKNGSTIQNYGTNDLGQQTLGRFLYGKGWAIPVSATADLEVRTTSFKIPSSQAEIDAYVASLSATDPNKTKKFKVLGEDQRIVGFEVGVHADNTKPGFDLQDNIFVVTSDVFKTKFAPSCFSSTVCKPSTGKP
jgi:type II secretory pathway pseudopilin PulG